MNALNDLIDKWVRRDRFGEFGKMPGLEVCIYESGLFDGLEWAAEEAATDLAKFRTALDFAVLVLCETRGHKGRRPCRFCRDMHLPANTGLKKFPKEEHGG
jgi:hypothetical protein